MTRYKRALIATTLAVAITAPLVAHDFAKGAISIDHPWVRETAQGQAAGGGFLTITNTGKIVDKLVSGSTPLAAEVQIHTMTMDGGIMRMRRLTDGLAIPARSTIELKPGSYHIMFMGLKTPLKGGTKVPVTLQFQHAGKIKIAFAVRSMTDMGPMPAMDHGHAAH
jgi:periplasmic copper chaperone A